MARYKPKPAPFLTPVMTGGRIRGALKTYGAALDAEGVCAAYSSVTKGKYSYSANYRYQTVTFAGGPRSQLRIEISGGDGKFSTSAVVMEYGGRGYPLRERGQGALRRAFGGM